MKGPRRGVTYLKMKDPFERLLTFLEHLPSMQLPAGRDSIGRDFHADKNWWVKFSLDTEHPLAWRVVQELGYVLNYISLGERLPTVFMPVSPPPSLNGGVEFISWVIESRDPSFSPEDCVIWLEDRLPSPVHDVTQWDIDSDDPEP